MFKVGEYLRYGSRGIFQVRGIQRRLLKTGLTADFYVLTSVFGVSTQIITPISNLQLKPVMTRAEVEQVLDQISTVSMEWIDDKHLREETCRKALEEGNGLNLAALIKMLYLQKQQKLKEHKDLSRADSEAFRKAEELLREEISLSLGIAPDQVHDYIVSRLQERS